MNVIFEKVRWFDRLCIYYYLKKGYKIYVFDFNFIVRKKKWLRKLFDNGFVTKMPYYGFAKSNILALDNIEKIYETCFKKSYLINSFIKLYRDTDIELAYKKIIVEKLSNFYSVQLFIKDYLLISGQQIAENLLIPADYSVILSMLKRSSAHFFELKGLKIAVWPKFINLCECYFKKVINVTLFNLSCACAMAVVGYKIAIGFIFKPVVSKFRYAVAIHNPAFQFKSKKNRTFDFLLDNCRINKDNTCFILSAQVKPGIKKFLKTEKYSCIDAMRSNVLIGTEFSLCFRAGGKMLITVCNFWLQNIFYIIYENNFIIFPGCILLFDYLLWNIIQHKIKFDNYITFNDEGMRHIARNIVLRQNSCKTWFYAHSASFGYICTAKKERIKEHCHWLWAYLVYDFYIAWNKIMIEYQKLHRQKIGEYVNIGCIWSTLILKSDIISVMDLFRSRGKTDKSLSFDLKVISVFDTSFFDAFNSEYPVSHGIKFYEDILLLLEENKNLCVIVKEKKSHNVYAKEHLSAYTKLHKEFSGLLERLAKHPRALVIGFEADPSEIIKISDLVVTYAFSSSTVEALGCRKKAIFYDPTGTLKEYYYNEIPCLVCCGYDELKNSVKSLLYKTDTSQYDQYLNTEIMFKIEDYLDGMALERFRNMLVCN